MKNLHLVIAVVAFMAINCESKFTSRGQRALDSGNYDSIKISYCQAEYLARTYKVRDTFETSDFLHFIF